MSVGRLFHTCGAAMANAQSPNLLCGGGKLAVIRYVMQRQAIKSNDTKCAIFFKFYKL